MIVIEEKNIMSGLYLKKISFICMLIFLFSCSPFNGVQNNELKLSGLLRNFIQADKQSFTISTPHKIEKIENIKLNYPDDFTVVYTKISDKGSTIKILKTTDKLFQGLTISFIDDSDTLRKEQVNFYSKLINVYNISKDDEIVFDRKRDIVPPLFFMSTSIQDGLFKVCVEDEVIHEFSMLHNLYFLSFKPKPGYFSISEVDCKNILFRYVVLP